MSTSVEEIMRARYDDLGKLRQELLDELVPVEEEWRRLGVALQAMGADVEALSLAPRPLVASAHQVAALLREPTMGEQLAAVVSLPRERDPEVQAAIDSQTPSQAIPKGVYLYCADGCETAHDSGGFTDQMALRTHTRRHHDGREPTAKERTPR